MSSPGQSPGSEQTHERVLSSEEANKCYICYEEQSEENKFANPNPCNCRGTIKIHTTCFDTLTAEYDTCSICKTKYLQNEYKKYYYPNGQLKEEGLMVNNVKTGLWKTWYTNGQLMEEVNYVDGKTHGLYRRWYENGQLKIEVNCVDGIVDGLYQRWYEYGELELEVHYVDGTSC